MSDSEIEALASAIARELMNSPVGDKADQLTLYANTRGIVGSMSESAVQQKISKAIRHHVNP